MICCQVLPYGMGEVLIKACTLLIIYGMDMYVHIHHLNTSNIRCGTFLAYVKAVNGAGESDPSSNVSIPSLPDIGPVTASLSHQVWKHDGEIRVI